MGRARTKLIGPDSLEAVKQRQKQTKEGRELERLTAVRMAMSGEHTLAQIAQATGRARSCIQTWLEKFEKGGIDELLHRKKAPGAAPALKGPVLDSLRVELKKGTFRTAGEVQNWLQKQHRITLQISAVYYWLKKLERG